MGGVCGYLVMNNVLKIDVLYVKQEYRHQQLGKQLVEKIEAEAKAQGAYLSKLETYDFQALEFYKKQGYDVYGVLEDCPAPGHQRYSLKKNL
jgi:GNAT superfamily N-acetyltransferase